VLQVAVVAVDIIQLHQDYLVVLVVVVLMVVQVALGMFLQLLHHKETMVVLVIQAHQIMVEVEAAEQVQLAKTDYQLLAQMVELDWLPQFLVHQ
jgi:hypothetical protein